MGRVIFHSDMNCYYASVEMMLDISLRGRAVAVCGSQETRHGIVLAKSQKAKEAGVKTGMAIWQAHECCPGLIVVPPQYDQYIKYSNRAHEIYLRYTDQMEPYGMDECFLDVTGCTKDPEDLANEIRETVKFELGLTVSVGVSFNKVFAKLGSDMKKPDAVTVITEDDFRQKVWRLPASDLLYCGPATTQKLAGCGIHTIGELAAAPPSFIHGLLGKNGDALWIYANGRDTSRVMTDGYEAPIKSMGHGVTCVSDLTSDDEVWHVCLELAQDLCHRLRVHGFLATAAQISVRDNGLSFVQCGERLEIPTRSPREFAGKCFELFRRNYRWETDVRAVCIRASSLVTEDIPRQFTLFDDEDHRQKVESIDLTVEELRRRFGKRAVYNACLMGDIKMHEIGAADMVIPGMMYV